jgi:FixJ family two-component response regulator
MNTPNTHCYIVDDDLSFGRSLKRLLNAGGMAADCFSSAQSFLDSVHPGQRGCAIVDVHMPGMDGFGLMEKMRFLHYVMPVIMVTGQTQADTRDLAMARGAAGFLQKPFSAESLLELIAQDAGDIDHP